MWISQDSNYRQGVIYLLSLSLHWPNGVHSFSLLSSHKVMIDLFHVFHAAIVLVFPRPYEVMYQIEGCNSIH